MSAIRTRAPSLTNSRAMPSPKPPAAPVTMTTFPSSCPMIIASSARLPAGLPPAASPPVGDYLPSFHRADHIDHRAVAVFDHRGNPLCGGQRPGLGAVFPGDALELLDADDAHPGRVQPLSKVVAARVHRDAVVGDHDIHGFAGGRQRGDLVDNLG